MKFLSIWYLRNMKEICCISSRYKLSFSEKTNKFRPHFILHLKSFLLATGVILSLIMRVSRTRRIFLSSSRWARLSRLFYTQYNSLSLLYLVHRDEGHSTHDVPFRLKSAFPFYLWSTLFTPTQDSFSVLYARSIPETVLFGDLLVLKGKLCTIRQIQSCCRNRNRKRLAHISIQHFLTMCR